MAMRPEFERRPGTRQFHGGPIAAFIDVTGDFAIGMMVGGRRADYEFPDRLSAAGDWRGSDRGCSCTSRG
jgi:hypothetical protein